MDQFRVYAYPDRPIENARSLSLLRSDGSEFIINVHKIDGSFERIFTGTPGNLSELKVAVQNDGTITVMVEGKGVARNINI